MIGPIEKELGWRRGDITAGVLIFSIVLAIVTPVAGRIIDRVSERRIGIPAILVYCALLASFSLAQRLIGWWAIWAAIAAIAPFVSVLFWTTVVARRFDRQRGLALAFTLCGAGLGVATMPALSHLLIDTYGWRGTYRLLALGGVLIIVPLAWLLLSATPHGARTGPASASERWTLGEALRSTRFLRLTFAGCVLSMLASVVTVHFVPMMLQRGLTPATAAAASGLFGIGGITGRIVIGTLLDRSKGPLVAACAYALPLLPCALLLGFPPIPVLALATGFTFGLCSGSEQDVLAYLTSRYFGVARYASVYGLCFAILGIVAGIAPWVAGIIYDVTGTYTIMFGALAPLAIVASLALLSLGPYPPREKE
jgi:MFS family permease